MIEIWKDIEGYEGWYQVSNLGNVKSLDRYIGHYRGGSRLYKGAFVKQYLKRGYLQVRLKKEGKSKYFQVHRLVASAFIECNDKSLQVNHKDLNKENNNISNLEWVTPSENIQHALKAGRFKNNQKLNKEQVKEIRNSKETLRSLAKKHSVSSVIIHRVKSGTSYKQVV